MPLRTHLDLFSGIGGFALAAGWAGFETVQFIEIDPFCRKVLGKHWPHVPIHDDIQTFSGDALGRPIDLLTGGFPCQPHSVAGKRLGAADDRHLWPEMARVIGEVRPRWVLGENVAGLIPLALDACLSDLEALGYEAWSVVVPACAVNAPHRRDRVWIVAYTSGERVSDDGRGIPLGAPGAVQGEAPEREWIRTDSWQCGHAGDRRAASDAEDGGPRCGTASWQGRQPTQLCKVAPADAGEGGRRARIGDVLPRTRESDIVGGSATPINTTAPRRIEGVCESSGSIRDGAWREELERRDGCGVREGYWDAQSGVGPLADGVPGRVARLKALGNAIVPQVAYEIIRLMD